MTTTITATTAIPLADEEPKISFSGFSDFNLDLSTLSPPSSPGKPELSPLPFLTTPPSHESTPRSSKSPSLFSQSHSLNDTFSNGPARKMTPSPLMMSPSVAATMLRGSWPLVKHVGRGTPVDKTRRVEWGTLGGEEVAEDGLLLSTVRSTSLDSISRKSQRPASPEWSHLLAPRPTVSAPGLPIRPLFPSSRSRLFDEPPPELPIPVDSSNSEEWSSLMHMVLKSSSPTQNDPGDPFTDGEPELVGEKTDSPPDTDQNEDHGPTEAVTGRDQSCLTPEEIRQLDMELGNNLGLNEALNLGLSLHGGMNLFNLDIIPPDGGGRVDSPSVYPLDDETPQPSRPPSIHALEDTVSDNTGGTEAAHEAVGVAAPKLKRTARSWWQRFVKGLRRVHSVLHFQRAE